MNSCMGFEVGKVTKVVWNEDSNLNIEGKYSIGSSLLRGNKWFRRPSE